MMFAIGAKVSEPLVMIMEQRVNKPRMRNLLDVGSTR